ncbi:MAG TPA: GNAT family N-acetyltransferase [Bryobacteraceae bacterium]|nr:GNAT family N-acetyltransferase [Bryobacteraceae bacterium]
MAALPDRHNAFRDSLIDLRDLSLEYLSPLLEEETQAWRAELDWDFKSSGDLVRRFIQLRALNGYALVQHGEVAGYSYYVAEEGKGLIGDFYVRPAARGGETEMGLLQTVLESLWRSPGMRRIEAQLMMFGAGAAGVSMPYARWLHAFPRRFFEIPLSAARSLPPRESEGVVFAPWAPNWQEEAARLISIAYRGHVDSLINDQYRSAAGARRFLVNIVQFPGCGAFFAPAAFIAWDRAERALCGISLASLVAEDAGHITQICVAPPHQGKGIGYELLRRSLIAFAAHGCRTASLTVTSSNEPAIRLYEQTGFRSRREFAAYVWEMR